MASSRKKASVLLVLLMLLTTLSPVFANDSNGTGNSFGNNGMGISFGSYSGTAFEPMQYSLNKSNGQYVNFWIKNKGDVDVKIKINDSAERVLKPQQQGHIFIEMKGDSDEDVTFKALPTPNGGDINIDYRIAQRRAEQ